MTLSESASSIWEKGYNCSQSVLAAVGPALGISENTCLKLSTAFGGGMGRQQYTCGAVTGALMALGLRFGMGTDDPAESKSFTYSKAVEFMQEFRKINGSVTCRELLDGLDMNDPAGHQQMVDQGMFENRCKKYVQDAVNILEKMMKD
jgi:C_GCAxxG_C_C family probable redox protein